MNNIDIVDLIYDYVVEGLPSSRRDGTNGVYYTDTITSKYRKYMPGKSDSTVANALLKELKAYGIKTNIISGTDGRGQDCGLYNGGYLKPMRLSKADIRDYVNKQNRGKVKDLTEYYNKYISTTIGENKDVDEDNIECDTITQEHVGTFNKSKSYEDEYSNCDTEFTSDDQLPPEVIRRAIIRATIIIIVVTAIIKMIW